jgi:prephenate dehydratase
MTADKTPPGPPAGVPCITSFAFRVRNLPAALYKAMGGLATNGVNMTKLESYMENGAFTATFFYAEVDGRPEDPALARALEELSFFSDHLEILGVFPADSFRTRRPPPKP